MKRKVCNSEKFEFVSEERVKEPGEYTAHIRHYQYKRCQTK